MIAISTKEIKKLQRQIAKEIGYRAPVALAEAMNRAASTGAEFSRKEIRAEYPSVPYLRGKVRVGQRAYSRRLQTEIAASASMIPAYKFNPDPRKPGFRGKYYQKGFPVHARPKVTVEIRKGRRRGKDYWFWQTLPNGKIGIFKRNLSGELQKKPRTDKMGNPRPNWKRQEKMDQVYTLSATHMFEGKRTAPQTLKASRERFYERLDHNVEAILAGVWQTSKRTP